MATAKRDLVPGDVVWLTPALMTAPAVCYRQPKAVMVRTAGYGRVVVRVDGVEHEIAVENVRRSNPNREARRRRPAKATATAEEDVPLW